MAISSKIWQSPGAMIGVLILALVLVEFIKTLYPLLLTGLVGLGGMDNFTFSGLFSAGGLVQIVLSAGILVAVLVLLGIKMGGSKR